MIQLLAPLLGGLGGLLFPTAGAAATGAAATGIGALLSKAALPALGAGLGTLAAGGGGKDAIRNALLMGVGVNAFPGLAGKIRGSEFGQSVTEGLAGIFGGGTDQAPATSPFPQRRPEPSSATVSTSGINAALPGGSPMLPSPGPSFEDTGRSPAPTTLPSLSEMAAMDTQRREREAAAAFDLARALPGITSISPGVSFGVSGMESEARRPAYMPITGTAARNRDMQTAMDMAAEEAAMGNPTMSMDLLDIANRRYRGRGFAMGGEIEGPGTGTSDSIPAEIYQDGKPVQKAALSDGEFVMTAKAVKGAGNGSRDRGISRMYELMRRFESGEMA